MVKCLARLVLMSLDKDIFLKKKQHVVETRPKLKEKLVLGA